MVAVGVTLFLACTSCASKQRVKMYPGADLPDRDLAVVTGEFDRNGMMVTLEQVDGVTVPGQGPIRGGVFSRETQALVTTGAHTVSIQFWSSNVHTLNPTDLRFSAEAGHVYEIRVGRAPGDTDTVWSRLLKATVGGTERWTAWVIDTTTGGRVVLEPLGAALDAATPGLPPTLAPPS